MSLSPTSTIPPINRAMKKTYGKPNYKQYPTFLESNFDSLMSKYNNNQHIKLDNTKSTTTNPSDNSIINSGTLECTPEASIHSPTKTNNKYSIHKIKNKSVSLPTMKSNNPFDTKVKNTPTKFVNSLPKRTNPVLLIPQTRSADLFGFPESESDTETGPISEQIVAFRKKRNRLDRHTLSTPLDLEEPSADTPPKLKSPKQEKSKQTKPQKPRQRQHDSKSPKRPKEHAPTPSLPVELFDVKQPHQCRELGQQQMFRDEVQYLLDGIKPARPLSTRCLALCSLASECLSPLFRRQLSFHQLMSQLTQSLSDTPASPPPLKLAAAALLYALSRDRSSTELDSGTILVILRLTAEYGQTDLEPLTTEKGVQEFELSQATKNTTARVSDLLGSLEPTESHPLPPKGPLTHQLLALMALQSLVSLQKEEFSLSLSEMGGLEHATTLIASSLDAVTRINQAKTDGHDTENKTSSIKYSKFKKLGKNITEFSLESQSTMHIFVLSFSLLTLNGITKKYAPSLQQLAAVDCRLPHLLFRCIQINREFLRRDPACVVAYECLKQVMMSVTELCNEIEQFSMEIYESAEFLTSLVECVLTLAPTFIKEYQFDVQIIGLMALVNHLAKSNAACESFLKLKSPSGEMLFLQFVSVYFSKQKEADRLSQELSQVIHRIKLANSPQTKGLDLCGLHDDAESQKSRDSSFSTSQLDRLSMLDSDATDPLRVSFPIEYFNSKLTHDVPSDSNKVCPPLSPGAQASLSMSAQEMSEFIREAATSEEVKGKATANFESSILAAMISLLVGLIASKNRTAQALLSQRMGVAGFEKMATLLHQMLSFYNLVCDSPLAREKTTQLASEVLRFFTSYL